MKLILPFLILLVLGASMVPCCSPVFKSADADAMMSATCCADDAGHETENEEGKENGCGTCSPFFTCGNCTGFSFVVLQMDFNPIQAAFDKNYSSYLLNLPEEFSRVKWQPPKI